MNAAVAFSLENLQTAAGPCQGLPQNRKIFRARNIPPPSIHPDQAKPKGLGMDTASTLRKNQEQRSRKVTKADTAERVSFALQAWGKDKSAPIVRVQQIADVDRATAAAWWHGRNPPLFHHLVNLANEIPELKGEVRRLLCMEANLHPDFERDLAALLRRYGR